MARWVVEGGRYVGIHDFCRWWGDRVGRRLRYIYHHGGEKGDDAKLEILRNTIESTDQVPCSATSNLRQRELVGCVFKDLYCHKPRLGHCVIVIQIPWRVGLKEEMGV